MVVPPKQLAIDTTKTHTTPKRKTPYTNSKIHSMHDNLSGRVGASIMIINLTKKFRTAQPKRPYEKPDGFFFFFFTNREKPKMLHSACVQNDTDVQCMQNVRESSIQSTSL